MTQVNLNNASFEWGCNHATHWSVFVQLCLRKAHLFSVVEGRIQSVTEANGEGLGANQRRPAARAYNFKWWRTVFCCACSFSCVTGCRDDMTLNQNSKMVQIMFGIVIHTKDTDNSITHKLAAFLQIWRYRRWPIGLCNSFEQLVDPMLKVLLFIAELLMHNIFIFFFSAELCSSQYLLLRGCSRGHDTMHEHCVTRYNGQYHLFCSRFVDLTLSKALSFCIRYF